MHRWVWDLRYPEPKSLDREYPISAIYRDTPPIPSGPVVLPGTYTVKLTVGGKTLSQPLTIKMDPRVKASTADMTQQLQIESKLADLMNRDYDALEQVRSVRTQLKNRQSGANRLSPELSQTISNLDQKAAGLDGSGGRAAARLGGGGDNLAALNSTLTALLNAVDSSDVLPTTQQVKAANELQQAVERLLGQWNELKTRDIPALNEQLRRSNVPVLNPEAASSDATTMGAAVDED